MNEIKLINKDTIIPEKRPLDWDVVINDIPYYVVKLDGYIHTIGGSFGENDYWAYPRDEKPTYENLIEYCCNNAVLWGIEYRPRNYTRCKWGECKARNGGSLSITRNGKEFDEVPGGLQYGIDKARVLISEYGEHPLDLHTIDFDKNMVGRKIWWRSQPAKVERFIWGQGCIILVPDGIDKFKIPEEFKDDCMFEDDDPYIKTHILDKHIWWFRD